MHTARSMQLPRTALLPASHATQRVLLVASGIELSLHSIHSVPSALDTSLSRQLTHVPRPHDDVTLPASHDLQPVDMVCFREVLPGSQLKQPGP
jgi:hypothetical protein